MSLNSTPARRQLFAAGHTSGKRAALSISNQGPRRQPEVDTAHESVNRGRGNVRRKCTDYTGSYVEVDVEEFDADLPYLMRSQPQRQSARAAQTTEESAADGTYFPHHAYRTGTEQFPVKIKKAPPLGKSELQLSNPSIQLQSQKSRSTLLESADTEPIGMSHRTRRGP